MSETEDKYKHARDQAEAQLSSIREMVANLEEDTARRWYIEHLDREEILKIYKDNNLKYHEETQREDDAGEEDLSAVTLENLQSFLADYTEEKYSSIDLPEFEFDEDEAVNRISEDAMSLRVRSDWVSLFDEMKAAEFELLLCTGGPACRIIGELDERGCIDNVRLQYQDWFVPWEDYRLDSDEEKAVERYARCFNIGDY